MRQATTDQTRAPGSAARQRLSSLSALMLGLALCGCAGAIGPDGMLTLGESPSASAAADGKAAGGAAQGATAAPAKVSEAALKPADAASPSRIALEDARKLKAAGKRKEAMASLEKAAEAHPDDRALQVEQGLLALELGQAKKAQQLLSRDGGAQKDWRVLSGLGVAHASQGRQAEAQKYFKQALAVSPDNPSVLNNLAMSLILERKVDEAEALLRKASASAPQSAQLGKTLALAEAIKTHAGDGAGTP